MNHNGLNVQDAINAIRRVEEITCDDLQALFNVIASKMTEAKFSEHDLNMIDEASGFICGETV